MSHLWFVCKLFFPLVPHALPVKTRQDGEFLITVADLAPELHYLNPPSAFLLGQCDGQKTVLDLIKAYMVEFLRSDRDIAAYEVVRALRRMELGAIVVLLPPDRSPAAEAAS